MTGEQQKISKYQVAFYGNNTTQDYTTEAHDPNKREPFSYCPITGDDISPTIMTADFEVDVAECRYGKTAPISCASKL
ncbi:hypothetical protein N7536_005825 [Penicillium majusculum]|nr:hypothetical protein N7536_005825 [Penicillium majusculum]